MVCLDETLKRLFFIFVKEDEKQPSQEIERLTIPNVGIVDGKGLKDAP